MKYQRQRQSGIELLKIFAMLFIVISHVTQTLMTPYGAAGAFWDLNAPAVTGQHFALWTMMDLGVIGNGIFFISSAWFLCGRTDLKPQKLLQMEGNVWLISVLMLAAFLLAGLRPDAKTIVVCLFPTLFSLNWYITCYMLFYLACPFCNRLMAGMTRQEFARTAGVLFFCYILLGTLSPGILFSSQLIVFFTLYFVICYIRQYLPRLAESVRCNLLLLACGLAGMALTLLATSWINTRLPGAISPMRWYTTQNLFNVMIAFSLFQLFRRVHFVSRGINRIAGLSMLIYLLHDNLLVKTHLRPLAFVWLSETYGFRHIAGWVLVFALGLFAGCAVLGGLYQLVTRPLFHHAAQALARPTAAADRM